MNAIIGFSEASLRQIFGPLNEQYLGYFRDILGAGRHLLGIISDILDAANIEKRTLEVGAEPVRAADLMAEARSLVSLRAEERNIDMSQAVLESGWMLSVDPVRTRQIFVNLLSNAIKFTPEGGAVGIKAKAEAGNLDVTVWDTGVGIPADQQTHIFDNFYQANDALRRGPEGIGLGLGVSRYLARRMGGDILVESEPGKGSRFTVRLPLAESGASEEQLDMDLRGLLKKNEKNT